MAIARVVVSARSLNMLMASRDMTPGAVGRKAECSDALIRMLRSGKRRYIKLVTAQQIAGALDVGIEAFATPLPDLPPNPPARRVSAAPAVPTVIASLPLRMRRRH